MSGARILLVEDDEVLRDLMKRNLEAHTHKVWSAEDGATALLQMRATTFDLILLDIHLPDQVGWDVLRTAQQEEYLHLQEIGVEAWRFPVVVISSVRLSPHSLAAYHLLAYLPKPFSLDALLHLAAEAARRSKVRCEPTMEGEHVT